MTIEKALKTIDAAIQSKQDKKTGFLDPNMSWNKGNDTSSELAKGLAEAMEKDIEWFEAIKKQLLTKHPTCKHPKKLLDKDPDEKLYCMGCNQDL